MSSDTDQALLERFRSGDHAAFATLVVRYQRPVYNAAYWILRNAEDADDIVQVVFLRVAERAAEYKPKYKFFSWIYRIAVNESLNFLRRDRREEALDDEIEIPGAESANPEWQLGEAQTSRRIQGALLTMTTNDRMVLCLRHFSECSYEEIGQILDLDVKTVKSRLFDARHRLRELLRDLRVN